MVEIRVKSMTVGHGFDSDFIERVGMYSFPNFHRFVTITKKLQLEGLYQDRDNSAGKEQRVGR